jgi:hypothetical protein
MTVTVNGTVFCDFAPCGLTEIYLLYVGIFYQNVGVTVILIAENVFIRSNLHSSSIAYKHTCAVYCYRVLTARPSFTP